MKETIGFVGLGAMGKPMVANLLKKGFSLVVYDIREEVVHELVKLGVESATSVDKIGQSADSAIVMVRNFSQVEQAVLGEKGLLSGLKRGSTLIIMSTISPSDVIQVDREARKCDIRVLDVPVSGGTKGATQGTLTLMVGGDKKLFEEKRHILEAMGKNIYYIGDIGMGQTTKLIVQLLVSVNMVGVAEVLALGAKAGLDLKFLLNILSKSAGDSWVLRENGPIMVGRNFEPPEGVLSIMTKDSGIALDAGRLYGIPLFLCSAAHQLFQMAENYGLAEKDESAIIKLLEQLSLPGT